MEEKNIIEEKKIIEEKTGPDKNAAATELPADELEAVSGGYPVFRDFSAPEKKNNRGQKK